MGGESLVPRTIETIKERVRTHRIDKYLDRRPLLPGRTRKIPTGAISSMKYRKPPSGERLTDSMRTNRNSNYYDFILFSDQFKHFGDAPPILRRDIEPLAGGREYAFRKGARVLEVASGEARALYEYSREFPGAHFFGVDIGYRKQRKLDLDKPGVQLTKGNWNNLSDIIPDDPDERMDTIIVAFGALTLEPTEEVFRQITIVAREGAILRYNTGRSKSENEEIKTALEGLGWEVRMADDGVSAVGVKGGFDGIQEQVNAFFEARSRQPQQELG